jgi:hypothetical protein
LQLSIARHFVREKPAADSILLGSSAMKGNEVSRRAIPVQPSRGFADRPVKSEFIMQNNLCRRMSPSFFEIDCDARPSDSLEE